MILIYRVVTNFFYPLIVLLIYLRKLYGKESPDRYKEKIFSKNFRVQRQKNKKLIWFHAASVGEVKSIFPLIDDLINNKNNIEVLITTVTLSSSFIVNDKYKKNKKIKHRFFPADVNFLINRFLKNWKPNAIFLIDSEIWPNLILAAKKDGIPIAVINARLTSRSFSKWMIIPKTAKKIFKCFDFFLVSDLDTKNRLNKLKLKNIFYFGNIKFIEQYNNKKDNNTNKIFLRKQKFWLAASTHDQEEIFCLKTHKKLKKKVTDIVTIIVPRHINRVKKIKKLCASFKLNSQILNSNDRIKSNSEILIINSYGVLANYYKYSNSVFIGKSISKKFHGVGGQNPIEAANFGCNIYHGPYIDNFKEIYKKLNEHKIARKVKNDESLSNFIFNDIKTKNAKNYSPVIKKISKRIFLNTMKKINTFLKNENI